LEQAINIDILNQLNRDTLSQPKVLLIEDCKCDTVLIKHILNEYYPFTLVDSVETKSEANKRLSNNTYDLVLLDLNLPDTSGLGDIGDIRLKCPKTPLIIVTGTCNTTTAQAARKYKADGIIAKSDIVNNPFSETIGGAAKNIINL